MWLRPSVANALLECVAGGPQWTQHSMSALLKQSLCNVAEHGPSPSELFLWCRLLLLPPVSRHGDAAIGVLPPVVTSPLLEALVAVSAVVSPDRGEPFSKVPCLQFDLSSSSEEAWAGVRLPSLMPLDSSRLLQSAGAGGAAGAAADGGVGAGGAGTVVTQVQGLWPPASGYSVSAWLRVNRYDAVSTLLLIRMQSGKGKQEVEIAIHAGIVVISCDGRSVDFSAGFIYPGKWCHIVVTHQHQRVGVRFESALASWWLCSPTRLLSHPSTRCPAGPSHGCFSPCLDILA